ncbi:hypothetical protein SPRG_15712 [Saprolegnia parasitica CBS 223.65]|uniref:Uncharacterized protein n=1 Tax=Saprolegnia parasitica (strain CBS 223.65) TaxID=695850 RepID=A0A067BQU5_SAPPC|nr:hypothetical protein SPRG_15712 [Saprolegnia parasitica CBS 223.65]KDO19145.1 hypothetical protein SPRG_15712 [Saprolegnia parasitica CBS 223.65]|eukprot:XP_012210143.1 hypothetical protein SPRG_15712 [Saprolegnia parasitica CBS 223.65]
MIPSSSSARAVLTQPDLREVILAYQDGVPCSLQHMFQLYYAKLEMAQYQVHPNLKQMQDPLRMRGYLLCRLLQDNYCDLAHTFLDTFTDDDDIKLPSRSVSILIRNTIDNAVRARNLSLVKRLHARPAIGICSQLAMDTAAANGDLEIVQFLHQHRSEGCSRLAFKRAKKHKAVLAFLKKNRPQDEHRHETRAMSYNTLVVGS